MAEFVVFKKTFDLSASQNAKMLVGRQSRELSSADSDATVTAVKNVFDIKTSYWMDPSNGGGVSAFAAKFPSGKYQELTSTPEFSSYRFIGWFDHAENPLSGIPSLSGQMTSDDKIDMSKLSIWAHWQTPVSITFDAAANGGQMPGSWVQPNYYAGLEFGNLPKPIHPTLYFAGWYTAARGGNKVTKTDVVDGSQTLYAQYTSKTYELIDLDQQWELNASLNPDASLYDGCYQSFSNYQVDYETATLTIKTIGYSQFTFWIRSNGAYADYVWCESPTGQIMPVDIPKSADELYYEQKRAEYEALGYQVYVDDYGDGWVYWYVYDQNWEWVDSGQYQPAPTPGSTQGHQSGDSSINGYLSVGFTFDSPAENYIYVHYTKNSGWSENDDRGYVLIPEQADSLKYLTFTAGQPNSSVRLARFYSGGTEIGSPINLSLEYNMGGKWQDWDFSTINLSSAGSKVQLRAKNFNSTFSDVNYQNRFIMTGTISASGRVTSLLDTQMEISSIGNYQLSRLFSGCSSLITAPDLDALYVGYDAYYLMFYNCKNLVKTGKIDALSADGGAFSSTFANCYSLVDVDDIKADGIYDTYKDNIYYCMFENCSSLIQPPKIYTTTYGALACYRMFYNCINLSSTPEMSVHTMLSTTVYDAGQHSFIDTYGYASFREMFENCRSLTTNRMHFRTNIFGYNTFSGMFSNCSALTSTPQITINELHQNACYNMFSNCKLLSVCNVELLTTDLYKSCYETMFYGCTSLKNAPDLPAKTLAQNCYCQMFNSCSSLTDAPYIGAQTLADQAMRGMFGGCRQLSSISVDFTSWDPSGATYSWVSNVSPTGVFTCQEALPQTVGVSNIPQGWTVNVVKDPILKFTALEPDSSIRLAHFNAHAEDGLPTDLSLEYNVNNSGWQDWDFSAISLSTGDRVKLRAKTANPAFAKSVADANTFVMTGKLSSSGSIMSLLDSDAELSVIPDYGFANLFYGCSSLVNAPDIDAKTVGTDACFSMFTNCSDLSSAPIISIEDYVDSSTSASLQAMFMNCPSLVSVDSIKLASARDNSFHSMFYGCTSLSEPPTILAENDWGYSYCGYAMFAFCSSLTATPYMKINGNAGNYAMEHMFQSCTNLQQINIEFPLSAQSYSYSCMFQNCTSLLSAPPIQTSAFFATYACQSMFEGCSSLTAAPALTADRVSTRTFMTMFRDCISLSICKDLKLNATNLSVGTYWLMFSGCSSLTEAPYLPANVIKARSYFSMFMNCSSLSSISVELSSWTPSNGTASWVANVAPSGNFYCPAELSIIYGDDNIPTGWNVIQPTDDEVLQIDQDGSVLYDEAKTTKITI